MSARLEHANLIVRDIDATIRFIQTALPGYVVRHDAVDPDGSRWVHIGTDESYLALNQATAEPAELWRPYTGRPGVNHLGIEVDDVDALRTRMLSAGYRESTPPNSHPFRKRVYFYDPDGNDWEFVQYLTSDPAKRNDYTLPG